MIYFSFVKYLHDLNLNIAKFLIRLKMILNVSNVSSQNLINQAILMEHMRTYSTYW